MTKAYPITQAQKRILDSFSCERLSSDRSNLFHVMYGFRSRKGGGLVQNLQKNGWIEDRSGNTAYYLVKDPTGDVLLFFSLKCGVLFDPDYFQDFMKKYNNSIQETWAKFLSESELRRLRETCQLDPRRLWYDFLYSGDEESAEHILRVKQTMGAERFRMMHHELSLHAQISNEKKSEPNQKIIRVPESFSAIELVEFCANDLTKHRWAEYDMGGNRMGETLFWYFVVPKMLEINKLIGSEYAFLFAADEKANGTLVRYYRDAFHFQNMTHLGTVKPGYDLGCFFLGERLRTVPQELRAYCGKEDMVGLDHYQKEFFDNFNQDTTAADYV